MVPCYGWGSTVSRLKPLRGGSLLFTTSSQKFLVLILLTLERWRAKSTLEPASGSEHGNPELGIQHLNYMFVLLLQQILSWFVLIHVSSTRFFKFCPLGNGLSNSKFEVSDLVQHLLQYLYIYLLFLHEQ